MKKNKKRKQKKKQGNVRRQKKLNNKKRKRQQVKHKNNQANSLKQNSIENSYPIPKRVTTKDSKPKKRPRPIIPRNNYSFFRDLFNLFDPFEDENFLNFDDSFTDSLYNENTYNSSYYTFDEEQYLQKMREYKDNDYSKVARVEYDYNIIDYNNMNQKQLNFYFYWRSQARKGNYLNADYNYYYLYFVELLNMIGSDTPIDALNKLIELFRKLFKGNDHFSLTEHGKTLFANRIFDFAYFHNLDLNLIKPYIWSNVYSDGRFKTLLTLLSNSDYFNVPAEVIINISDVDLFEKSKIYSLNRNLYMESLTNVFYVLDFLSKKQFGTSFINSSKFNNKRFTKATFDPFENAVVDSHSYERQFEKSNINFRNLKLYFSGIVQEVENTFRSLNGIRGRLRKFDVDPWAKNIINDFLNQEYQPETNKRYTGDLSPAIEYLNNLYPERKIEIDSTRLDKLREETEVVQDLMDTSNYEENSQDDYLIHVDALTQVLSNLVKTEPNSLKLITSIVESKNNPVDINTSEINENILNISKRFLSQPLFISDKTGTKINNEYFKGVDYILENKDNYPFLNIEGQNISNVGEELLNFLDSLDETQHEFIKIVLNKENTTAKLEELAMSNMTMVELIFDDINNNALLYLDDIVLDRNEEDIPYIIDEYTDLINKAL